MTRKIIHLDLDAFFCAVEECHEPSLRGKPFAVGGRPEQRGVVASCSYAARRFGIRSAMPMARAVRLCPDLIIVRHRHREYSAVSQEVMELLREEARTVEQISIDEAFLDVSYRTKPAESLARHIQTQIRTRLSLPSSLGVATNKLVAKIATDVGKASAPGDGPPNAIQVVPPGQEAAFLAPLPASALWGVGPKTAARLAELGIHTIGDIAGWPPVDLARRFGKHGWDLVRRAQGIDDRQLTPVRDAKSISRETTFAQDVGDEAALRRTLDDLSRSVGRRLRRADLKGTTVKLKIRWPDFTTLTRQTTLAKPTDQDEEIIQAAQALLMNVWQPRRPVRLLGVGVSNLSRPDRQLTLWEADPASAASQAREKERRLDEIVQDIKNRYGEGVVWKGPKGKP